MEGRVELATGITLTYTSVGPTSAAPVVLLHAWAESRRSFDRVLSALPGTVRALSVDLRGHGEASAPRDGYSLAGMAEDVVGFMDAVGLQSAVLVGSSSGGYVAQQVAVTRPDRVEGLVLVGSPRSLQGRPPFADEVERLTDPVDERWVRDSLSWFPRFATVPDWYVEARVRDGARLPAHVWRAALDGLRQATPPTDTATIGCPTLITWGDRDALLSWNDQQQLSAAIPGSRLLVYEGTGHLVLWEQPLRVAKDIATFRAQVTHEP